MERLTLGHLVPSSESAGNTVAAPESAVLAQTAPGSAGILPPSPTSDNVLDTAGGSVSDYARLKSADGGTGSRPANDGPDTTFQSGSGWTQT